METSEANQGSFASSVAGQDAAVRPLADLKESPSQLPHLLFAAGLLLWAGFQTITLIADYRALNAVHANQETTVQQSVKIRKQLDSIAAKTQILADQGNPGAKTIVEELKKNGVMINPNNAK